jgi:hypothetical protein
MVMVALAVPRKEAQVPGQGLQGPVGVIQLLPQVANRLCLVRTARRIHNHQQKWRLAWKLRTLRRRRTNMKEGR